MIISHINALNFRGLSFSIDVKEGANFVCGANGSGKSRFSTAIQWCLTGKFLHKSVSTWFNDLVTDGSQNKSEWTMVEVFFSTLSGERWVASRSYAHKSKPIFVLTSLDRDEKYEMEVAQAFLLKLALVPESSSIKDRVSLFLRSHFFGIGQLESFFSAEGRDRIELLELMNPTRKINAWAESAKNELNDKDRSILSLDKTCTEMTSRAKTLASQMRSSLKDVDLWEEDDSKEAGDDFLKEVSLLISKKELVIQKINEFNKHSMDITSKKESVSKLKEALALTASLQEISLKLSSLREEKSPSLEGLDTESMIVELKGLESQKENIAQFISRSRGYVDSVSKMLSEQAGIAKEMDVLTSESKRYATYIESCKEILGSEFNTTKEDNHVALSFDPSVLEQFIQRLDIVRKDYALSNNESISSIKERALKDSSGEKETLIALRDGLKKEISILEAKKSKAYDISSKLNLVTYEQKLNTLRLEEDSLRVMEKAYNDILSHIEVINVVAAKDSDEKPAINIVTDTDVAHLALMSAKALAQVASILQAPSLEDFASNAQKYKEHLVSSFSKVAGERKASEAQKSILDGDVKKLSDSLIEVKTTLNALVSKAQKQQKRVDSNILECMECSQAVDPSHQKKHLEETLNLIKEEEAKLKSYQDSFTMASKALDEITMKFKTSKTMEDNFLEIIKKVASILYPVKSSILTGMDKMTSLINAKKEKILSIKEDLDRDALIKEEIIKEASSLFEVCPPFTLLKTELSTIIKKIEENVKTISKDIEGKDKKIEALSSNALSIAYKGLYSSAEEYGKMYQVYKAFLQAREEAIAQKKESITQIISREKEKYGQEAKFLGESFKIITMIESNDFLNLIKSLEVLENETRKKMEEKSFLIKTKEKELEEARVKKSRLEASIDLYVEEKNKLESRLTSFSHLGEISKELLSQLESEIAGLEDSSKKFPIYRSILSTAEALSSALDTCSSHQKALEMEESEKDALHIIRGILAPSGAARTVALTRDVQNIVIKANDYLKNFSFEKHISVDLLLSKGEGDKAVLIPRFEVGGESNNCILESESQGKIVSMALDLAIISKSSFIVFDEPESGLDEKIKAQALSFIKAFSKQTIIVTNTASDGSGHVITTSELKDKNITEKDFIYSQKKEKIGLRRN